MNVGIEENPKKRADESIRVLPGERFSPYSLAVKLGAVCLLESSSFKQGRARYSILMVTEAFRVSQQNDEIGLTTDGKSYRIKSGAKDILDVLRYFAAQNQSLHMDLPLPAGGVGYLAFEFCRFCDKIPLRAKPDPLEMKDAEFLFGHVFIVFDHYTDLLYILGVNYKEHAIDLKAEMDRIEARINDLDFNYLGKSEKKYEARVLVNPTDEDDYKNRVREMRREIIAGNLLQGVPSRRLYVKTDMPALEAYKNLRSINPSPYLFYLDFGAYQLVGASPEVMVKVKENKAVVRPIAGTRKRGATEAEDKANEKELLADPKERAEHVMLIDLARNDLGRVCKPGSVVVTEKMVVERYSHVMHIVSEVQGELREGLTGADAFRATFPAGTVSGAPKIAAIKFIDAMEPEQRRFYAGSVGYMESGGDLNTCIALRTALKKGDTLVLQAGGGVVFDSYPEREFEETNEKLRALAQAIGVEV